LRAVRYLVFATLVAVLLADASGLSKAEIERIWLPFAVWLAAGAAAPPNPRLWLAAGGAGGQPSGADGMVMDR